MPSSGHHDTSGPASAETESTQPSMSAPSSPAARDTEEALVTEVARTISDSSMVFGASQAPDLPAVPRLSSRRSNKSKLKTRKCTPAPPTKGNSRKRLDLSPIPEDKQIRKKLDFEKGLDSNYSLALSAKGEDPLPDSGEVTGHGVVDGQEEDDKLNLHRSNNGASSKTNQALGGERVNFPNKVHGTKSLLESGLVHSPIGVSHVELAVGHLMETKKDNLLSLASLDSAEMLDVVVAQPFLGGSISEEAQRNAGSQPDMTPAADLLELSRTNNVSALAEDSSGIAGVGSHGDLTTEMAGRSEADLHMKTLTAPEPLPIIASDALVVHVNETSLVGSLPSRTQGDHTLARLSTMLRWRC